MSDLEIPSESVTTIVGITGTLAQFNTAVTDADLARTDAANTFTGVQTFVTPIAPTSVATMTATVGGGVPTPPNIATQYLNGQGVFSTPAGGGTGDMVLATAQTNSGLKTFLNATFGLRNVANTITSVFSNAATVARTWTLKDADGTIAFTSDITGVNSGTNTGDNSTNTLYSGLVSNATHTGEVTGATALTITANAVANTKLAQMLTKTYKGRTSALTGDAEDVAVATLKTDLVLVKADVGLGSVDNTSDASKPVSTAQQTALNLKQDTAAKDATGGYVGLTLFRINFKNAANTFTNFFTNATTAARTYTFPDKDITVAGLVDITGINSGTNTGDNATNTLYSGLVSNATHTGDVTGATALTITANAVTNTKLAQMLSKTYKGRTNAVTGDPEDVPVATLKTDLVLVKADVGLGSVDNTSDAAKPVSTAQATADGVVQAFAIARGNHSGTQLASTVSDFAATVRATVLTGLSLVSTTVIAATDTILVALGSLQAQITALTTTVGTKANAAITIATTAPLSGGGDLSANRTLTTSMNTNKLIGRNTAGIGVMEEITLGTNLSMTGTTLNAAGGGGTATVQDEGVTHSTTVTTFNFTGAGVSSSGAGATATINIPGGSGGDLALAKNILSANTTVPAGSSAYIPYFSEIVDTFTLEVGLASYLEIG